MSPSRRTDLTKGKVTDRAWAQLQAIDPASAMSQSTPEWSAAREEVLGFLRTLATEPDPRPEPTPSPTPSSSGTPVTPGDFGDVLVSNPISRTIQFGAHLDADGQYFIASSNGGSVDAAAVFRIENGAVVHDATLPIDPPCTCIISAVSIDGSGVSAVVSFNNWDDAASHLHFFEKVSGAWSAGTPLTLPDNLVSLGSVEELQIDGDKIFIGSNGAVRVLNRDSSGDWTVGQRIANPEAPMTFDFGRSFDYEDGVLVVLSRDGFTQGRILSFVEGPSGFDWVSGLDVPENLAGSDIDMSSGRVVIGSWIDSVVRVFDLTNGTLSLMTAITKADVQATDNFGRSVAVQGGFIAAYGSKGTTDTVFILRLQDDAWVAESEFERGGLSNPYWNIDGAAGRFVVGMPQREQVAVLSQPSQ